MKVIPKIMNIMRVLDHFYPRPPIPLNHFDNFSLLVAVVLSAQTTDGKVNQVTDTLFKVAPDPEAMSKMEPLEIQPIIQQVGLAPKKAIYLRDLSKMLIERFDGSVPCTYKDLESLPGVGHKTASVIMSQAFGEHAFAVDTHVHRLSLRWGLSLEKTNVGKVQADLCGLFPEEHWNKLHLQMIYFGREYCTAKDHTPSECPICSWVNKRDGASSSDLQDLSAFSPHKRAKGIVYYHERESELKMSPHLVSAAKREVGPGNNADNKADFKEESRDLLSEFAAPSTAAELPVHQTKPAVRKRRSKIIKEDSETAPEEERTGNIKMTAASVASSKREKPAKSIDDEVNQKISRPRSSRVQ